MKLDVKELLSKFLDMWEDWQTNNTVDTWIPVFINGKIQHRVLSRNQTNNIGSFAVNKSVTVSGNSTATVSIDVSSYVNGYAWTTLYVNNSNTSLIAANYWQSGTTVTAIFWNRTSSSATGNMQLLGLRWKTDT